MRKSRIISLLLVFCLILIPMTVTGVYASWTYFLGAGSVEKDVHSKLGNFVYGDLYITKVRKINDASTDVSGSLEKTGTTTVKADIDLGKSSNAVSTYEITFYNSSDVVYYYKEAETLESSNNNITYDVTGIEQKEAVESKTYKTIRVTFGYKKGAGTSNTEIDASILFKFVVDKDSIGEVVARTAVERFREILNNIALPNSYEILDTAMSSKTGWSVASSVTYIGNVAGSTSSDSKVIEELFGEEFMSMDLDGDGKIEPITLMIKRENLDNNLYTGGSYTYKSGNRNYTVDGVEMTLYITSHNLDNVNRGQDVVVYAAAYTKKENATEWTALVPLTKGTAEANNYSSGSWGDANSFNTDTWESDGRKTMDELAVEYSKK